ncbi:phospho-acceptor domain-containing protein [Thermosporothrix hazakensis]|jgi:signal transduction histidine kinase|uniref:histidine kinase n=1 Tax=Thermosporothrix hazakensis TaxID=644383 RepID=A0A326U1F3_THEHA|nr:HAMP domain-containing sensor histidine kinase [Thermosporothrix hazakensis]PZW23525.1 phospho-acceptor domain-containing protein [Thermosporothrix hazakensis]GCE51107.1 hypothetical protein KTH_59760 [Thermosporothrix hazakensis]
MEKLLTRLLLIEDDEEDYLLLKRHLAKIPNTRYEIDWTTDYNAGLDRMLSTEHDICMLDYRLGAHNGIELIRNARSQHYAKPIILLTGASEYEIDIQALQAGADDYISKTQLQSELLYRVIRYAIERKKAELEREKLLREQIESKELEQRRNEFISIVTHELKTPLTSLKAYAQLLRRRFEKLGDEQLTRQAMRMDSQINKLTGLIDDLLDVTRIEGGKLKFYEEFYDFDALVNDIIEEIQPTTDKVTLIREGSVDAAIWGDRERTGQVITNFLSNAIKYAPEGERVIIRTCVDDQNVTLCVQDFGPGIPKEEQENLFTPFYRIEQPSRGAIPGMGLGLYISAEIIQRQNGRIWVESEEGHGSTFCFSLPLHRAPSIPEAAITEA